MHPTQEWLALKEEKLELLNAPVNLRDYFSAPDVAGKRLVRFPVGKLSVPSGRIVVKDPVHGLAEAGIPYHREVMTGAFELAVAAVLTEFDCARYAAAMVSFTGNPPVRYEEALTGTEDLAALEEGRYFGFPVQRGLVGVFDELSAQAAADFCAAWQKEHPGADLKADYFDPLLRKSYEADPTYQRPQGDWMLWTVPGTDYTVPIFQSGFGNGVYAPYFGIDEAGEICCLVVHLIDVEFEFGEAEGFTL